ncbi:MAG: CvpA family protein [Anaerohalosphaeraceae bacterium]
MVWAVAGIFAILFAWLGVKKGVYTMAAAAFNFLLSVYIAVLSAPTLLKNNPPLQESPYYAAFAVLFMTAACFTLLQGICFYLFLRDADCVFPEPFEKGAGALLGLLIGYILTAQIFLAVCMMPFSRHELFERFVSLERTKTFSAAALTRVCRVMAGWSLQYLADKPEKTIGYLLSLGDPKPLQTPSPAQPPSSGPQEPSTPASFPRLSDESTL